jgi:transcriptional regulator with XRE-family HTH domain
MYEIKDRVKALRESRKYTQTQLGEAVRLSTSAISSIEKGLSKNPETLKMIANHFGVSDEWLIYGNGEIPNGVRLPEIKKESENPWRDATIQVMKEEIAFLREIVKQLTGKNAPTNFLKALKKSSPDENGFLRALAA